MRAAELSGDSAMSRVADMLDKEIIGRMPVLLRDLGETARVLERMLQVPDRRTAALRLASLLGSEVIVHVVPVLTRLAGTPEHALAARQVLGQLAYEEARGRVPSWVDLYLDDADSVVYGRYKDLLEHLGLHDALRDLRQRAGRSLDPATRKLGEEPWEGS